MKFETLINYFFTIEVVNREKMNFFETLSISETTEDVQISENPTSRDEISSWKIGDFPFFEPETLQRELKEFRVFSGRCLHTFNFDESFIKQVLQDQNFSLLLPILKERLFLMIQRYTPKYGLSFFNTDSIPFGEVLFGLTDDGEVTGVIIPSDITEKNIRQMVFDNFSKVLFNSELSGLSSEEMSIYFDRIREKLQIRVIDIDPDSSGIGDFFDKLLTDQQKIVETYRKERAIYANKRSQFHSLVFYYHRAIESMLKDENIYEELFAFIRSHVPIKENVRDQIVTNELRESMISRILNISQDPISFEIGQISDEKTDINNVAYWVTEFREVREKDVQKHRPDLFLIPEPVEPYTRVALSNPVARIMNGVAKEKSLRVVIISIVFPGHESLFPPNFPIKKLSYFDENSNIRTTYRSMGPNGPCCS